MGAEYRLYVTPVFPGNRGAGVARFEVGKVARLAIAFQRAGARPGYRDETCSVCSHLWASPESQVLVGLGAKPDFVLRWFRDDFAGEPWLAYLDALVAVHPGRFVLELVRDAK